MHASIITPLVIKASRPVVNAANPSWMGVNDFRDYIPPHEIRFHLRYSHRILTSADFPADGPPTKVMTLVRASTVSQRWNNRSTDAQSNACKKFCEKYHVDNRRQWDITEQATSECVGPKVLDCLRQAKEEGCILVVSQLDRFSKIGLERTVELLEREEGYIVIVAHGKIVEPEEFDMHQLYPESERIKQGLENMRENTDRVSGRVHKNQWDSLMYEWWKQGLSATDIYAKLLPVMEKTAAINKRTVFRRVAKWEADAVTQTSNIGETTMTHHS